MFLLINWVIVSESRIFISTTNELRTSGHLPSPLDPIFGQCPNFSRFSLMAPLIAKGLFQQQLSLNPLHCMGRTSHGWQQVPILDMSYMKVELWTTVKRAEMKFQSSRAGSTKYSWTSLMKFSCILYAKVWLFSVQTVQPYRKRHGSTI